MKNLSPTPACLLQPFRNCHCFEEKKQQKTLQPTIPPPVPVLNQHENSVQALLLTQPPLTTSTASAPQRPGLGAPRAETWHCPQCCRIGHLRNVPFLSLPTQQEMFHL